MGQALNYINEQIVLITYNDPYCELGFGTLFFDYVHRTIPYPMSFFAVSMDRGDHSETLLLLAHFSKTTIKGNR